MSGTALDHPLVRDYLRDLDRALATLAPPQARELTEQITAHLDDALAPGSTDREVAAVLRRLGSPAALAAEASGEAAGPGGTPAAAARARRRAGWPRLGWRRWTLIGAALLVVGTAAGYRIAVAVTPPIQFANAFTWWYPQDSGRAVETSADGLTQTTVPIRSGQRQGYAITVYNPSDWTQTVLGAVGIAPGSFEAPQVGVATADPYHGGGVFLPLRYTLPGPIPPHQIRALRVMWISDTCLEPGSSQGSDQLTLRVRVGGFTRTEVIYLPEGVYISGPSKNTCS